MAFFRLFRLADGRMAVSAALREYLTVALFSFWMAKRSREPLEVLAHRHRVPMFLDEHVPDVSARHARGRYHGAAGPRASLIVPPSCKFTLRDTRPPGAVDAVLNALGLGRRTEIGEAVASG